VDVVVDVPQTWQLDVDTGTFSGTTRDLWFRAVTATERYFEPVNGAGIVHMGAVPPGFAGCSSAPFSASRIAVAAVPAGNFLCLRTAGGRFTELQLMSPIGPSPGTMRLHVRTFGP